MKRSILFIAFFLFAVSASARKSYVTVRYYYSNSYYMILSGDIPAGMKESYNSWEDRDMTLGGLLNELSQNGFEVEQMSNYENANTQYNMMFLLSSTAAGSSDSKVQTIGADNDEAFEVARYNLQGLPIDKETKGVQVIVYSNYTTKTIIKE